jgi:hypothetical protein
MRCLSRTGLLRHVLPHPGKMVQDAEEIVDGLHSEAVVEAAAGSEAEATPEAEGAVMAAATRMAVGEAAVFTTESALSLSLYILDIMICFFIIISKSNVFFPSIITLNTFSACSSLVLCNQCHIFAI